MPPPDPIEQLYAAPLADIVTLLLRQFERLLQGDGVELSTRHINTIGDAVAAAQPVPQRDTLSAALHRLVEDSIAVLRREFELTFARSLCTTMQDLPLWESTSDFIDIANIKSNAELRISAGSTLLLLLHDTRHTQRLLDLLQATEVCDASEVDAVMARRALAHHYGVDARLPVEALLAAVRDANIDADDATQG